MVRTRRHRARETPRPASRRCRRVLPARSLAPHPDCKTGKGRRRAADACALTRQIAVNPCHLGPCEQLLRSLRDSISARRKDCIEPRELWEPERLRHDEVTEAGTGRPRPAAHVAARNRQQRLTTPNERFASFRAMLLTTRWIVRPMQDAMPPKPGRARCRGRTHQRSSIKTGAGS